MKALRELSKEIENTVIEFVDYFQLPKPGEDAVSKLAESLNKVKYLAGIDESHIFNCYREEIINDNTTYFTNFEQDHRDIYMRLKFRGMREELKKDQLPPENKQIKQAIFGSQLKDSYATVNFITSHIKEHMSIVVKIMAGLKQEYQEEISALSRDIEALNRDVYSINSLDIIAQLKNDDKIARIKRESDNAERKSKYDEEDRKIEEK